MVATAPLLCRGLYPTMTNPRHKGDAAATRLVHSVRPVAMEVAERRKPDWPLHSEAVRHTLRVSQKSKKEIPNYTNRNLE